MISTKVKENPQGMVLIFVLGILALLAILGATVFLTTKDEVQVSSETHISRDAFTKADLTARVAVFLARTALTGSAGDSQDSLAAGGVAGRPEFVVELDNFSTDGFQQLEHQITDDLIRERYLMAVDGHNTKVPHVKVYYQYDGATTKRQLIGTAAVGIGYNKPDDVGGLADGQYDDISEGGATNRVYLVISADGRIPTRGRDAATPPTDPSNYIEGDSEAKHGIVTAIYRELM